MGWMFVPLSQYHGGGAAATVEPLDEHREHYRLMIRSNLAAGVQACYRGPRLFDTDRVRQLVADEVDWFKKYRVLLEADVIHGSSRRADGRDIDWILHSAADTRATNPAGASAMLCVFNPLDQTVRRRLQLNLYYTGINDRFEIIDDQQNITEGNVDRRFQAAVDVEIPGGGFRWFLLKKVEDK